MAKQHPKYGYWYDHSPEEWREICRTHSTAVSVTGGQASQMIDGHLSPHHTYTSGGFRQAIKTGVGDTCDITERPGH